MAWANLRLGEVASIVQRGEIPQPGTTYRQVGVRWWGEGVYIRHELDGSETKYPIFYRLREDDIVINKIWARHGSISLVPSEFDGAVGSSEFPTYEVDRNKVMPAWIGWFAKSRVLWSQCELLSQGTSGQNRLRPERFLDVQIPLPSLDEQRRIVARLDRVASLVNERRQVLAEAEKDADTLLRKAFELAIEGADYRPMEEVAPLVRRPVYTEPDREYTEIGVKSFYRGIFHRRTVPGSEFSWQKLFWVREGDLVFSNLMAWEQAIGLASSQDDACVGNHRMLTCEVNRRLATPGFLMAYFRSAEGFQSVLDLSPGTIARNKTLSSKRLPTLKVPVPRLICQEWYDSLNAKVQLAKAIRDDTGQDLDALIPAMLRDVFGGAVPEPESQLAAAVEDIVTLRAVAG